MDYKKLLTSYGWCKKRKVDKRDILDPDGWDRKNYHYSFYNEKINILEFIRRLSASTVRFTVNMQKILLQRCWNCKNRKVAGERTTHFYNCKYSINNIINDGLDCEKWESSEPEIIEKK